MKPNIQKPNLVQILDNQHLAFWDQKRTSVSALGGVVVDACEAYSCRGLGKTAYCCIPETFEHRLRTSDVESAARLLQGLDDP